MSSNSEIDVLVLGGGPAGTWAACSAAASGARVVLADKGFCGTSGATAAALTQAILDAAEHVANDPDDAGVVFGKYSTVPPEALAVMVRTHTHHHHPSTPNLKDELAVYISDMKLIGVLKPSTDPNKFASRIYANVLTYPISSSGRRQPGCC